MTLQQLNYYVKVAETHSMRKAAEQLYVTQPTISKSIKELEKEFQTQFFIRSNLGISTTPEGREFLTYARQVLEQAGLLNDHFHSGNVRKHFSVATQHYTFAIAAFINMVKRYDASKYAFALKEMRTAEVIEDVHMMNSELGIMFLSDFNKKVLGKLLEEDNLSFTELFACHIYVFLAGDHPLASKKVLTMEDLKDYPCLSFDQGTDNSFYFAEEMFSTYQYQQTITVSDRASMTNLMKGLHGYTLCSGIICPDLNDGNYTAIPFDTDELMHIGYIHTRSFDLSSLAREYVDELKKYEAAPGFEK